jgi:hypothetical protein
VLFIRNIVWRGLAAVQSERAGHRNASLTLWGRAPAGRCGRWFEFDHGFRRGLFSFTIWPQWASEHLIAAAMALS